MSVYDCIVAGAGIEGSSTAFYLAKNGFRTLLLEQFPLPHTRGSSHGQSRTIRKAYVQPLFAEMMKEAYQMWRSIENKTGTLLMKTTGNLVMSLNTGNYVEDTRNALNENKIDYKDIDPQKVKERYHISMYPNSSAILDPEGGILKANLALQTYQNLFQENGGFLLDETQLFSIDPGEIVTVHTNRGSYVARNVVLCLGPWSGPFFRQMDVEFPLKPIRVSVGYYKETQHPSQYDAEKFPTFFYSTEKHNFYGLPSYEYPGLVKVALHDGPEIDPDKRDDVESDWPVEVCNQFVKDVFPGLEPKPSIVEHCIYTNTPDEYFLLDRHPIHQNIILGAGFSGHGFKLAPVVGKILGELAMNKVPSYNLERFRLDRFKKEK